MRSVTCVMSLDPFVWLCKGDRDGEDWRQEEKIERRGRRANVI